MDLPEQSGLAVLEYNVHGLICYAIESIEKCRRQVVWNISAYD